MSADDKDALTAAALVAGGLVAVWLLTRGSPGTGAGNGIISTDGNTPAPYGTATSPSCNCAGG